MCESDAQFNEEVFEITNSAWREYKEKLRCSAISSEVMIKELVEEARKVEMETFKKHGACAKVPIVECWESTGKAPAGVKRVDATTRRTPSTGAG
jgi:hypothetical protein